MMGKYDEKNKELDQIFILSMVFISSIT